MALVRRSFTSKVTQESEKVVIVGIDFGTSFTKVYFNQGGEIKQPLKFDVQGESTYFVPTQLYYNQTTNQVFFEDAPGRETLKYFKYSMINKDLVTSEALTRNNKSVLPKPELLCSIFYIASLIKEIKNQISDILKTSNIKYSINMGCPIDNFGDNNRGAYDTVLKLGYQLSLNGLEDGMTINALHVFYEQNKNCSLPNLQTIPELYAEALWFIEQPSTGEGIYTILDIGGGTVDFANIFVKRTSEGEKKTTIYSQNVIPLGVEILLQYMYPNEYLQNRDDCLNALKANNVKMPHGWTKNDIKDRKLKKAIDFSKLFSEKIIDLKNKDRKLMENQYSQKKQIPYYTFGGGADFKWYHSIIDQTAYRYTRAGIPPLIKQPIICINPNDNRLVIAEQLTRSSFPEIDGFPWHFAKEEPPKPDPDKPDLDDIQKEKYGN